MYVLQYQNKSIGLSLWSLIQNESVEIQTSLNLFEVLGTDMSSHCEFAPCCLFPAI